ncbi:leucyl aminopeptidase [Crateriforma conspicua]|uniref:Probable cytosol aminopeptidase n=1 Tax=Crateriforma conspicua TaxID=2527996 RepID=A0A5C5YCA4_9PLAN|nr:leucyl aminopeptidase [Crateriforma conspicua]TWT71975.1 Cytosol aminopeptidase [Crateriforma conspicua]
MPNSLPLPTPKLNAVSDLDGRCDCLVVGVISGTDAMRQTPGVSATQRQLIDDWIGRGEISGKCGEVFMVTTGDADVPLIMTIGTGAKQQRSDGFDLAATAIRKLTKRQRQRVVIDAASLAAPENVDAVVAGALAGCETQGIYQQGDTPQFYVPTQIDFLGTGQRQVATGKIIGDAVNRCRRLVNEPAGILYPESFAARAQSFGGEVGLEVEVWDEHRLESEGCRAILAVGQGSARRPRLVILRHNGAADPNEAPIALVGKGVTFDSGGLSLKPSEGMVDMKCDMAGAATVASVMRAVAQLKIPRNVIGFCGLAENMVSGSSYKLGDVIETRQGTTIEILNTDAEGRVVLADTLDVAVGHQPQAMVDLATLTGACMVALGREVTGLMSNRDDLCGEVRVAADAEGEPAWQLPMFSLYDEKIKSKVADIKNVGEGRWGGAITAAKLLEQFVGDTPWVHMDIAGPAFADSPLPHRDAGATGAMVRTLLRWIQSR